MKAMILCAGFGTRLKPWTDSHPKALVPIGGEPMLGRVIRRLRSEGFDTLGVNVHHFYQQIEDYLGKTEGGGEVLVSRELPAILDTGGGLVRMAPLLDPEGEGFLVHNVDILSNADLAGLMAYHRERGSDVTLLVSDRKSTRKLCVDGEGNLSGWVNLTTGEEKSVGSGERLAEYSFSGIYVVGPEAIREMRALHGDNPFPIMDYLLDVPRRSRVAVKVAENLELIDIGKPETLSQADKFLGIAGSSEPAISNGL